MKREPYRIPIHTTLSPRALSIISFFVDNDYGFYNKNKVIEVALELLDSTIKKVAEDPLYFRDTLTKNERKLIILDIIQKRKQEK